MHLWIDGQCLQTASRLRGIGRYVHDLISAHAAGGQVRLSVSLNAAFPEEAIIARAQLAPLVGNENIHLWHGIAEAGEASTGLTERRKVSEIALAHHVACIAPDIALCASPFEGFADPAVPLLALEAYGIPLAAICYDFIPLRFARQYLTLRTARETYERRLQALGRLNMLLAISEFAASEANEFCPGAPTYPIMAGLSEAFSTGKLQPPSRTMRRDFHMLYVGSLDWRKNPSVIARATALIEPELRAGIHLDVAGAYVSGDMEELRAAWVGAGLKPDRLHFLGSPTDEQLAAIYRNADVLIQPSLMEGFGLTALEAMACGTTVLAARAGSLPEVVQNAEALFDPADPGELAQKISRLLREPTWADDLRSKGKLAAQRFTWKGTAHRTVQALSTVLARVNATPNQQDIRTTSLKALNTLTGSRRLSIEGLAQVMAHSEISKPSQGRLLVDVTETVRSGLRTGIQRVVRKTIANLKHAGEPVYPFYCDTPNRPFCADLALEQEVGGGIKGGPTFDIRADDHLLLLDSSWNDHRAQGSLCRAAKMVGAEVTAVIYDLVPIRAPAFCSESIPVLYKAWLGMVLRYADNLLCISRAVADDVAALLEEIDFDRKIRIGYWPLGADFAPPSGLSDNDLRPIRTSPEFLAVGTLEPRKGYRVILRAFELLWQQGLDIRLVIAGKRGWMMDDFIIQLRHHQEFGRRLYWVEAPSDAALSQLYRSASALVAASFSEGFGLPLVEATHYSKPVIASDLPVFREVAASSRSAFFFEPGNAASLANAISTCLAEVTTGETVSAQAVPGWRDSACALARLLRSGGWYRERDARQPAKITSPTPFHSLVMQRAFAGAKVAVEVKLIEGPVEARRLAKRYIFYVENRSQFVLSGETDSAGRYAVTLAGRAFSREGREVSLKWHAPPIPLVLGPGGSIYLSLEIEEPGERLCGGMLEVGLFQSESGWLGTTTNIALG